MSISQTPWESPPTLESNKLVVFQLVYVGMKDKAEEYVIMKLAQNFLADVDSKARGLGVYSQYRYLNYATYWQDPMLGMGRRV
jgi:hypothetical protein